jgi:hypothetical protein
MWRCVDLASTDISEERRLNVVDARSTQRHIPEDDILHNHLCESLKSYTENISCTVDGTIVCEEKVGITERA